MTAQVSLQSQIDLNRIVTSGQLPALPQSAISVLDLAKDPKNGPAEFARPIEADPGLMGQVLRFVNSAYFGFSREITSVRHATTLVGVRTIKNFVLWSAVFSLLPSPRCGFFNLSSLWQDSLRRALFARLFAKLCGSAEAEEPFVGALLQDMALPLLVKEYPDQYTRLFTDRSKKGQRLTALEQQEFGWNHAHVGGLMARRWNLPEAAAQLIESHADLPGALAQATTSPQRLAVAMSAFLPSVTDQLWRELPAFEAMFEQVKPAGSASLAEVLGELDVQFTDFAPVLKVATPPKSLVECYRESLAGVPA